MSLEGLAMRYTSYLKGFVPSEHPLPSCAWDEKLVTRPGAEVRRSSSRLICDVWPPMVSNPLTWMQEQAIGFIAASCAHRRCLHAELRVDNPRPRWPSEKIRSGCVMTTRVSVRQFLLFRARQGTPRRPISKPPSRSTRLRVGKRSSAFSYIFSFSSQRLLYPIRVIDSMSCWQISVTLQPTSA